MDQLIEAIRAAVAPDAPAEVRAAGIDACRTILTALGAVPGESMSTAVPTTPSPIAAIVAGLRSVPPDQLLDLAIAKLRAALPSSTEIPGPRSFAIPMVPIPGGIK